MSVTAPQIEDTLTHIIGIVRLPIRGVLQQQPLESQNLAEKSFVEWREGLQLDLLDFIIAYDVLHNGVELVQDLYPAIEVGTRPAPVVDLGQDIGEILDGSVRKLVY